MTKPILKEIQRRQIENGKDAHEPIEKLYASSLYSL